MIWPWTRHPRILNFSILCMDLQDLHCGAPPCVPVIWFLKGHSAHQMDCEQIALKTPGKRLPSRNQLQIDANYASGLGLLAVAHECACFCSACCAS